MIRSGDTVSPDNERYVPTVSSQADMATLNTLGHPSEAPELGIVYFAIELVPPDQQDP